MLNDSLKLDIDKIKFSNKQDEFEASLNNSLNLAFIGDAVWTLFVRDYFANNTNYKVTTVLTSINYSLAENIKNSTCTFTTAEDFGTCTFSVPATVKVNKAISFEGGKSYIIAVDNNILLWTEVQANS